jgi:hypothetical protein
MSSNALGESLRALKGVGRVQFVVPSLESEIAALSVTDSTR